MRAGVVGIGAFGRHHAAKYALMKGVELVGVADPCIKARRAAIATHGVPVFPDWRELLGAVDLVSVCSPAITHATIVRAFLNAGAHVLVEKPIATRLAEADQLVALAEATDRVLTVGHQERFVFARTGMLDYDDVPLSVECWRRGSWTGRGADVSVVLDLMIHDLDLVHRLVPGNICEIEAIGRSARSRHLDDVSAQLVFDNGTQVRLSASRAASLRRRGMRVVYSDGVIEIDFIARTVRNTTRRHLNPLVLDDPLGESLQAFVSAARGGAEPLVRAEEARHALATALDIEHACVPMSLPRATGTYAAHA
ncbi:MAG TPA: Gfo/Idh/MocA family oxidoreductase [Rhizomicrobium sp.]